MDFGNFDIVCTCIHNKLGVGGLGTLHTSTEADAGIDAEADAHRP